MGYVYRNEVIGLLKQIIDNQTKNQEKIMAGLADLQAATGALQAEVLKVLTDVQAALANDDPDAAVEAASQIVNSAVNDLTGLDNTVTTGSTTPPPTPAPPASPSANL